MLRNLNFILIEKLLLDSLKTVIKLLLCTFIVCKRERTLGLVISVLGSKYIYNISILRIIV